MPTLSYPELSAGGLHCSVLIPSHHKDQIPAGCQEVPSENSEREMMMTLDLIGTFFSIIWFPLTLSRPTRRTAGWASMSTSRPLLSCSLISLMFLLLHGFLNTPSVDGPFFLSNIIISWGEDGSRGAEVITFQTSCACIHVWGCDQCIVPVVRLPILTPDGQANRCSFIIHSCHRGVLRIISSLFPSEMD